VVGPVGRVSDALSLATSSEPLDGAVLDINLAGERVHPEANALAAYSEVTRCEKPVEPAKIGKLLKAGRRRLASMPKLAALGQWTKPLWR
jgi:hypothetical protein